MEGDVGDSFFSPLTWLSQNGTAFSARDHDRDQLYYGNCAEERGGGWW